MSLSVPGLKVRSQRMGTYKVDFGTVCAWSESEVAESG
jgi:hypothetical protein